MNNIVQIFFEAAEKYPEKTAIIYKEKRINYSHLKSSVLIIAEYFTSKGIVKGSKVMVFIPMSIKLYQTVLALFSIGAVVVFVDEWADRARLRKALTIVDVDTIIAPRKYLWLAYILKPFSSIKKKLGFPSLQKLEKKQKKFSAIDLKTKSYTSVSKDATALITFTTGSTGLPKAADRTHEFLNEQFKILSREIAAVNSDVCLVTLPIVLLFILGTGATGVIADFNQKKPEKLDAKAQLKLMKELSVSILIASPYYVDKLADLNSTWIKPKKILTGGAPVFPDMAMKIISQFPDTECLVAYGSTEAEPISKVKMEDVVLNEHGLSVGEVNEAIELKIISITENEVILGEHGWSEWEEDFGEIVVRGPHVLVRYYNSEEAFKMNKILDGGKIWHRTGDSGKIEDGILYLNGRCSQLIKSEQGYKSLFIIEYQLSQVAGVAIGTFINDVIILELIDATMESKVKTAISALQLGEKAIKIFEHIPRDPRHFSKIDYAKVLAAI